MTPKTYARLMCVNNLLFSTVYIVFKHSRSSPHVIVGLVLHMSLNVWGHNYHVTVFTENLVHDHNLFITTCSWWSRAWTQVEFIKSEFPKLKGNKWGRSQNFQGSHYYICVTVDILTSLLLIRHQSLFTFPATGFNQTVWKYVRNSFMEIQEKKSENGLYSFIMC